MTARHLPDIDPDPGQRGSQGRMLFLYRAAWHMAFLATREPGTSSGLIQGLTPYLFCSLH